MRKPIAFCLAATVLIGASSLLGGCNTTEGAGKDLSNTGRTISKEADKLKP